MRTQIANSAQAVEVLLQQNDKFPKRSAVEDNEATASEIVGGASPQGCTRDELLLLHLPIVRFVARRIHERLPHHVELDDLISAGLVGLVDAADKFDWSRQVQFKSYAQIRIRGAILDFLRTLDWSPRELRRKGRAMAEAIRVLSAQLGRTPCDVEIVTEMEMDLPSYQEMLGEISNLEVSSLNLERTEEVGDEELVFVPAPATENPLFCCIQGQTREKLAAGIEMLPEKERLVLTLYYFEELTLREIGFTLGVVESRVSQIRASAVSRLRAVLQGKPASKRSKNRSPVH